MTRGFLPPVSFPEPEKLPGLMTVGSFTFGLSVRGLTTFGLLPESFGRRSLPVPPVITLGGLLRALVDVEPGCKVVGLVGFPLGEITLGSRTVGFTRGLRSALGFALVSGRAFGGVMTLGWLPLRGKTTFEGWPPLGFGEAGLVTVGLFTVGLRLPGLVMILGSRGAGEVRGLASGRGCGRGCGLAFGACAFGRGAETFGWLGRGELALGALGRGELAFGALGRGALALGALGRGELALGEPPPRGAPPPLALPPPPFGAPPPLAPPPSPLPIDITSAGTAAAADWLGEVFARTGFQPDNANVVAAAKASPQAGQLKRMRNVPNIT